MGVCETEGVLALKTPRAERHQSNACIVIKNDTEEIARAGCSMVVAGCPGVWERDVCPGKCGTVSLLKVSGGTWRVYPESPIEADVAVGAEVAVGDVTYTAIPKAGASVDDPAAVAGDCYVLGVCK